MYKRQHAAKEDTKTIMGLRDELKEAYELAEVRAEDVRKMHKIQQSLLGNIKEYREIVEQTLYSLEHPWMSIDKEYVRKFLNNEKFLNYDGHTTTGDVYAHTNYDKGE